MDVNKQLEQIVPTMVKPVLHFFKIHGKVVFGNPPVIVQDMLGKTPKALNAVDVVLGFFVHHVLGMIDCVMLAQTLERVVAPKGVRVVDSTLPGFLPDDGHQLFLGDMLHNLRIHLAIALQKAKYDVFALGPTASLSLASATKVALIHLHLAVQFATLKLGHMVDGLAQALVEAGDGLIVKVEVMRETIGRLLLIEALNDGDFGSYFFERLLFSTGLVPASDITPGRLVNLERVAENTLSAPQKVGRTPENVLSHLYHIDILVPYGYETH